MSEPSVQKLVCDLTPIMRALLFVGVYSRRAVPPHWRRFAQACCWTLAVVFFIYFYVLRDKFTVPNTLNLLNHYSQYLIASSVSLWTGNEYIYTFFTQNKLTDVTLDSSQVFSRFQKNIKKLFVIGFVLYIIQSGLFVAVHYKMGLTPFLLFGVPSQVLNFLNICTYATKLLVMGLFNCRLLVLRRRLERYGFRTIGRAQPQPYCQIYAAILQGLDATDNPLKVLLLSDLISNCFRIINLGSYMIFKLKNMDYQSTESVFILIYFVLTIFMVLFVSFGHVVWLESAAAHCDAMAVFTVTQLIKTPTAEERRRMLEFLSALERRGARYCLLRALPLDARLVLAALGFCSAQALILVNTIFT